MVFYSLKALPDVLDNTKVENGHDDKRHDADKKAVNPKLVIHVCLALGKLSLMQGPDGFILCLYLNGLVGEYIWNVQDNSKNVHNYEQYTPSPA